MGRSILHRKSIQNKRRALDPDADHLMASTHYQSDAYDEFVEQRDNPVVAEPVVTLKQSELAAVLARIDALEARPIGGKKRITVDPPTDGASDAPQEQ